MHDDKQYYSLVYEIQQKHNTDIKYTILYRSSIQQTSPKSHWHYKPINSNLVISIKGMQKIKNITNDNIAKNDMIDPKNIVVNIHERNASIIRNGKNKIKDNVITSTLVTFCLL